MRVLRVPRAALAAPLLIGLALVAAAALLAPARAVDVAPPAWTPTWPLVRGAFHVHSRRSDGSGTLDDIAAAAARAGLTFVIVTDHGDATRPPEAPAYRAGVLLIDAVEISTRGGHVVALGLPAAPYPLAGFPGDVVEDIHRLGGMAIAAHPGSAKPLLQWTDWRVPVDGLEWLNADSEWRDEPWGDRARGLLTYPLRPVETLTAFLDRPEPVLARWDALTARRRVVGLAAADAHARVGFGQGVDPYEPGASLAVPNYEVSFRAFANVVMLREPLTGEAAVDAAAILQAVSRGHLFATIDGFASGGIVEFVGRSGASLAKPGDWLDIEGPVTLSARVAGPEGAVITLRRDGEVVAESSDGAIEAQVGAAAGAYRIEVGAPGLPGAPPVPWLVTNPIYVGLRAAHGAEAVAPAPPDVTARTPIATQRWEAEASTGSASSLAPGTLGDGTPALQWRFALAAEGRSAFAAMRFPVDGALAGQDRLLLRARADRPMRVWVQLRAPGPTGGERWGRSLYLDESLREYVVRFEDLERLEEGAGGRPAIDRVDSLLFVADRVNTAAGGQGLVLIPELWLAR